MCLTTGEIKGGKSTKWIPAWKEVLTPTKHWGNLAYTAYMHQLLIRRMEILHSENKVYFEARGCGQYLLGFHAWLKKPAKFKRVYRSRLLRCFIRKVTAVGVQEGTPAIVGREIFIPALRMDGTWKKQGNPKRKK